jgi:hypothetical protein
VAILVDGLTTIVGYGSLMIASHLGLRSLGRVLTIGVSCCTLSSLVILPAILALLSRRRETAPISHEEPASAREPGEPVRRRDPPEATSSDPRGPKPHDRDRELRRAPRRAA